MNLKGVLLKVSMKLGYGIYKIGSHNEYNLCPPYDYYTYSPWFEEWFQKVYSKAKQRTKVTEDRCYTIYRLCQHCLHFSGDFAECGVYKGGSAFLIADTLAGNSIQDRRVHLFDTFAGMPSIANQDPSGVKEGWFGDNSLDAVKNYLQAFPFVVFHQGVIPQTFGSVNDRKFSFVHIDVDLYQTTKDCCGFFYDRMSSGGIMIFDDYGFWPFRNSEKTAVDEFFKDKPEMPISLPTGQCIVIKL
jgi:O-methyltransferase